MLTYTLSEIEARALAWLTPDPPAMWLRQQLAAVVADYKAAGGVDMRGLKDALDSADEKTVAAVSKLLVPEQAVEKA